MIISPEVVITIYMVTVIIAIIIGTVIVFYNARGKNSSKCSTTVSNSGRAFSHSSGHIKIICK